VMTSTEMDGKNSATVYIKYFPKTTSVQLH